MQHISIKRALLSVSDKESIIPLAQFLKKRNVEIISTGGTKKVLNENGIATTSIEEITGSPEAFGGRMKSISFQIGSSLLYRRKNSDDIADAKKLNIQPIDLVVCNLYPFAKAVADRAVETELIENIDIGGPTMIRAGAKNYDGVTVLTSPSQYEGFMELYQKEDKISYEQRREFARAAFNHTAEYDAMIANELNTRFSDTKDSFLSMQSGTELRYGENPHQSSVLFKTQAGDTLANVTPIQGKQLSYNNYLDMDAAWKSMSDLDQIKTNEKPFAVSIIKHLNPCGIALGNNVLTTLEKAWAGDPVSSFGSIIAFNTTVDENVARWFDKKFVEIIIANDFTHSALEVFSQKKNLRLIKIAPKRPNEEKVFRSINGGILAQAEDEVIDREFQLVTKTNFYNKMENLSQFGVQVCKNLRSNAIALVTSDNDHFFLSGAGMGQPNRLDSLERLAVPRHQQNFDIPLSETLLVSDAFFPFRDSIEVAHKNGIKNIIQPGGSIRDNEVIEACDEYGIAMYFTGKRHFRH
jgi:phosphoribosylaminoimidazolecarboxamide formyltransferase/IMP cyclohydrolase